MTAYYSPSEVAASLKCGGSTIRKYASLLINHGYKFQTNKQGHRWYTDKDVIAFKKLIAFSKSGDMNLEQAAQAVCTWSKGDNVASHAISTERHDTATSERMEGLFTMFEEMLQKEQQHRHNVQQLAKTIERQDKAMNDMKLILERMEAKQEAAASLLESEKKTGFFNRLFSRS